MALFELVVAPEIAHAEVDKESENPSYATASIAGKVNHSETGEALEQVLVVAQCNCLQGELRTQTNADGIFHFRKLPPGAYTVQVFVGDKPKVYRLTLRREEKRKMSISADPAGNDRTVIIHSPDSIADPPSVYIDMGEADRLVPGNKANGDFKQVIDLEPTAEEGATGVMINGNPEAESNYSLEGFQINDPKTGSVGIPIVQEFLSSVEVKAAGYDAEYGGASSGQVQARRVQGTNQTRGEAGLRFNPRIADPRFILHTDEALRVTEAPDFQTQAYAVISGPVIKDRLFYSAGLVPSAGQSSLYQRFFHRVDKNQSGGYEDCPHVNGENDCVDGGNYIASKEFYRQRFRTGGVRLGYLLGLDWAITPNHNLGFTALGGPGFIYKSYRLPYSSDPSSFGTSQESNATSGTSRIATGVVDRHFGWDKGNTTTLGLTYFGRVLDGKIEIDANLGYFQSNNERAWKLDHPELKRIPATQTIGGGQNGASLYELLDGDGALEQVRGVNEACNDPSLPPGESCPIRTWLSGGLGEYGHSKSKRVSGSFAMTHFFRAKGQHQLKWGASVSWLQQENFSQYSGENLDSFYDSCSNRSDLSGKLSSRSGGEYCYTENDGYVFNNSSRVNNHRFIISDVSNPDRKFTRGYGAARHEQRDLRAVATQLGHGARVDAYNESLSTLNYAAFLQDKWAVLSNLYLNYGVRWEGQDIRDIFGRPQIRILDSVAPRLGIVYDWTDEGRSRLYASYGWFYQPMPLALNNRVFGGLVTVGRQYREHECARGQSETIQVGNRSEHHEKFKNGQPTEFCVDTADFTTGLSEGGVVPRLRGQYNQQFQIGYEQEIIEDLVLGFRWLHTDLGRALEDVSTDGGNTFIIANPGEGVAKSAIREKESECDRLESELKALESGTPEAFAKARARNRCEKLVDAYQQVNDLFERPIRNYDAWTFQLKKRFAKNWLLLASYTYSRSIGNYDGFVDPVTGTVNIGQSTQYDLPELVRNSYGPLSFNRPHRLKLDGFYTFELGKRAGRLTLGTSFRLMSGLPVNVKADHPRYRNGNLVYLIPRGSGGKLPSTYRWNLSLGYTYPLPRDLEIDVSARMINVTNAKAVVRVDDVYTHNTSRPIAGGELSDLKHAKQQSSVNPTAFFNPNIVVPQGNYGVETQFQQPMSAQLELKLRF